MEKDSNKRSFAKSVTWRFVGAIDTAIISWFLTGDPMSGLHMGYADALSKILFFYIHERIWDRVWTKTNPKKHTKFAEITGLEQKDTKKRRIHLIKAVTWRVFSSALTVLLGWIILNDPLTGLKIGLLEVFTKIFLYYLHE